MLYLCFPKEIKLILKQNSSKFMDQTHMGNQGLQAVHRKTSRVTFFFLKDSFFLLISIYDSDLEAIPHRIWQPLRKQCSLARPVEEDQICLFISRM